MRSRAGRRSRLIPVNMPLPAATNRRRFLLALPAFLLVARSVAGPFDEAGGEYQKKSEHITNFMKFVEWPGKKFTQPDSPLVIGIFGHDPISDYLREAIQGRTFKSRHVVIKHLVFKEELQGVHLLFISNSERDRLSPILSEVKREGVLTIGECDNFLIRGGVINFVNAGDKVVFEINPDAAERERLKIDSRLLNLSVRRSAALR